jgi:hypothetical protein
MSFLLFGAGGTAFNQSAFPAAFFGIAMVPFFAVEHLGRHNPDPD